MQLGKSWAIKYKKTTTGKLPFLRCWEQKQGAVHDCYTQNHQEVDRPPKSRLLPIPQIHPVTPFKDPSVSSYEAGKGTCFLVLLPSAAAWTPTKPCLISMTVGERWVFIWESNIETYTLLSHSVAQLCQTPWIVAHQAPLSMGFSRQEYCSGLP